MVQGPDFKIYSWKGKEGEQELTTKIKLGSALLTTVLNIDSSQISSTTCGKTLHLCPQQIFSISLYLALNISILPKTSLSLKGCDVNKDLSFSFRSIFIAGSEDDQVLFKAL